MLNTCKDGKTQSMMKQLFCLFRKDMCTLLKKVQKLMKRNITTLFRVTHILIAQRVQTNASKITSYLDPQLEFRRIFFVKNACPTFAKSPYLYLSPKDPHTTFVRHLSDKSQVSRQYPYKKKWLTCPISRSTHLSAMSCKQLHLQRSPSSPLTLSIAWRSLQYACLRQEETPTSDFVMRSFLNELELRYIRYLRILYTYGALTTFSCSSLVGSPPNLSLVSNSFYLLPDTTTTTAMVKTMRSYGPDFWTNGKTSSCLKARSRSAQHYLLISSMTTITKTCNTHPSSSFWSKRKIKLNTHAMSLL